MYQVLWLLVILFLIAPSGHQKKTLISKLPVTVQPAQPREEDKRLMYVTTDVCIGKRFSLFEPEPEEGEEV